MLKSLALISKKTLVATATSLTMVGTAGAALGTTISAQEAVPVDSTLVDTTLVDTTTVDTTPDSTVVDTTVVDATVVDTTLVEDTVVDTTVADDNGENGLCEAWEKATERGRTKNLANPAWSGLADEAADAGLSVDDFCDIVLGEKHSRDAADDTTETTLASPERGGRGHGRGGVADDDSSEQDDDAADATEVEDD